MRPVVGGEWREARHVGLVLRGRFGFTFTNGTSIVVGTDEAAVRLPGQSRERLGRSRDRARYATLVSVSAQPLPGVLAYLAPVLTNYGYFAVGGFITLEDFGVPVPGETILIAAAVYAGAGKLNVVAVGVIAVLAAIIGDNIGYTIGHFGGRALVLRFGKYVLLTSERLDKAERFFDHYGSLVVTFARFVEGLRQANGIVAGTIRMHWLRFLIFNALGAVLWVGLWTSVGYLAGDHITAIYDTITRYSLYVLIALGVAVAALIVRALVRRRRRISAAAVADGDAPAEDSAAEDSAAEDSAAEDGAAQDKATEAAPPAQKPTTRPD